MDVLVDFLLNFYGPTPYWLLFGILLACGLGLPIPEDITLFAGGILAYYGMTDLGTTIVVCMLGVILGDSLVFWLGHRFGRKLTKKWFFHKLLPDDRLDAVQKTFQKKGSRLIFFARFMPGLRAPIFFSAGTLHFPYRTFLCNDGLAALISVPTIIWLVYRFGDDIDKVVRAIQRFEHGLVLVIFTVIIAVALKWYITHRRLKKGEVV